MLPPAPMGAGTFPHVQTSNMYTKNIGKYSKSANRQIYSNKQIYSSKQIYEKYPQHPSTYK